MSIYELVPGGPELLRWFGQVPTFHDAEILSLHLRRKGQSVLRLHGWVGTGAVGQDGYLVLDRHAIVTFALTDVMDLQLDSFSIQNVISGLILRRAPDRAERRGYLAHAPAFGRYRNRTRALLRPQRPDPGSHGRDHLRAGCSRCRRGLRSAPCAQHWRQVFGWLIAKDVSARQRHDRVQTRREAPGDQSREAQERQGGDFP